ncbi:putative MFS family arabinose efflux permease [Chitinophaga polysaccharea]|uniref:Putative MFS family arabinose efflux permease n=1 Tax=Chitinophaga polysaccharea TaxID=1293035 RepID=A0A561PT66_9BACT|nr:MFS transporter [Chitinophaga polysaccharea]TWF41317.1 putative MFS family arabinose efflux permease [Chitinophaga polysaccharea]
MKQMSAFTTHQQLVITLLALTQFTVVLDFMVMSPLGDMLMKSMSIKPNQFGLIVSAYAFSAGVSGLLTAGFADRFDRKRLLVFFYGGFILGTFCCGLANSYVTMVAARIVTGLFGGVIGAISLAIVTDLFDISQRGRVMGFTQMAFGASQVLGIPIGLYLANAWGWEAPFLLIAGLALVIVLLIWFILEPVNAHLAVQRDKSAFLHLWHTVQKRDYRIGFTATALMSVGGFMMMPFGSAFAINNLHITAQQLPLLFMVTGVSSLCIMPLLGKLSDKIDKFRLFATAALFMMGVVIVYTHLSPHPLWMIMGLNILMMGGIMGRMIPFTTLITGIPDLSDRGAFMSVNSSLQQIAGGIAALIAGMIVSQQSKYSPLEHYDTLGWVIVGLTVPCIFLVYRVSMLVKKKLAKGAVMRGAPLPAEA